jgi:hypothetical protein
MFGVVTERGAHLLDAEVETLLEIDGGMVAPNFTAELVTRHELARPAQERRQDAEWLKLELDGRPTSEKLGALQVRGELTECDHIARASDGARMFLEASWIGHACVVRHRRASREHVVGTSSRQGRSAPGSTLLDALAKDSIAVPMPVSMQPIAIVRSPVIEVYF